MDPRTNGEDLKQEALQKLADSRGEIAIEVARLREKMNVKHAAWRVVQRHPDGVVATAFATGLAIAYLVFYHRSAAKQVDTAAAHWFKAAARPIARKSADQSLAASLARAAMPVVMKIALSKPWYEWVDQFRRVRRGFTKNPGAHPGPTGMGSPVP